MLSFTSVLLYQKPDILGVLKGHRLCRRTTRSKHFIHSFGLQCFTAFSNDRDQPLYFPLQHVSQLLSEAESSTSPQPIGVPPEPPVFEKYLISVAFVLGILVTIGVVVLTFAEWRNKRLRKESEGIVEKGEKQSQEPSTKLNRFARRLKRKEEKLRARKKL